MSIAALSPVTPEPPSPMITSITPTLNIAASSAAILTAAHSPDPEHESQNGASSPGPGPSRGSHAGGGPHLGRDASHRSKKPPPLHTGADWKVVLHLPEIETWLRATSDRVTQLTHSAGQDSDNRHVDVHLVQLKDICEDISDHVEQIHALLETEFSLKLLSYSVNIIVDIRTVQLLWHQLRVSVLVLKERLLQGLQDSNGNYTRQTDILQAFSQDQQQTRLDALTEVDDCGQLTIRCSQDYFSLDCGITAFELTDYSPGDEPEARGSDPGGEDPCQQPDPAQGPNPEPPGAEEGEGSSLSNRGHHNSLSELAPPADSSNHNRSPPVLPTMQCGNHGESAKRPLQGVSHSTEASPTQPSLPKRAALFSDGGTGVEDSRGGLGNVGPLSGLQFQAELSRSTPSLMDPRDRSKFWLELDSVYPENVSQSCESLQVMNGRNLQRNRGSSRQFGCSQGSVPRPLTEPRSSSGARPTANAPLPLQYPVSQDGISKQMERTRREKHAHSEGDSDSSLPSPMREQFLSSDVDASGEESDPRPHPGKTAVWILKRQGQKGAQASSRASPDREHWYGSEEFMALPDQLRKTEMLAMKLESLAQSIPLMPDGCDSTQKALQDVDDWDLTELNPDWEVGESDERESGDDMPSLLPPLLPYRRNLVSRFSSTSSSDIALSLDESIESGPLSDLQSEEDEGRRSAERRLQLTAPPVDMRGGASLVHQLLEDIQSQNKDPAIWEKLECFVKQLDGFISWLQEALDSTENWTQPRQDLDSLRVYLDTHLSFKLNVDAHSALKESVMEEGRALLTVITSHQSGLKDILHMVSSQWDQLQRQIRRQHGWMLRALRCIQARLLYTGLSHQPFAASVDPSANRQAPRPSDGLEAELVPSQCEAQRAALAEQMAVKLSSLHYPPPASRRHYSQLARNNSLQEFEAEYQELWDWLMDMDAMVTDSHQLMMSEEQRHHLFKSSHAELMMMESRKTSLLGRAESLKRSGTELPDDFHRKIHNLTHTWRQLEKILSEHSAPGSSSQQNQSAGKNSLLGGGRGVAVANPRSALSPLTNSLLEQLEARIKELKAWLRDTELLIFNSCLGRDRDAAEQLHSFKSLCSEVRARRRGVASVLKLCQKLLQQSQSGPMAEVGPEAEQHREALQLLSINLERRWEAIVMQALQWQNRLKRELGEQQVLGSALEPCLVDLHQISLVPAGPVAPPPDESWEWDETDMTMAEVEPQEEPELDLMHSLPLEPNLPSDSFLSNGNQPDGIGISVPASQRPEMLSHVRDGSASEVQPNVMSQTLPLNNNNIYQVYSLHSVELYRQPQFPHTSSSLHKTKSGKRKPHLLLKSLSKDSSFSSIESLPDLLGGLMSNGRGGDRILGESERESGRGSGQSAISLRSESESGIVSDTGETETTTTNSEIQEEVEDQGGEEEEEEGKKQWKFKTVDGSHLALHKDKVTNQRTKEEESMKEKAWRRDEIRKNIDEEKRRRHRRGGGEAVEILINGRGILTPADSDSDFEAGGLGVDSSEPFMSGGDFTEFKINQLNGLETPPALSRRVSSPVLSQGSSLESLLALGVELFPSKDQLHRSSSLESCLVPCRSAEEASGSLASLGDLDLIGQGREMEGGKAGKEKKNESVQGEAPPGELSRRTLDLLKRLENIQSPLAAKMTRSFSDMTLRSISPQRSRLPASPSLGGQHTPLSGISGSSRKGPPSLINESSATTSLTELSSAEDSSVGSEDFAVLRNHRHLFLDPAVAAASNANSCSYRKHCHGNGRGGQGMDEADAASLSLVVNVSCKSACTDEDEDDSDLLSSSTLTLTEEELGVRDEEDERLSGASTGNDEDEEEMEGSYVLGLEYMKRELQTWIRSPRSLSSSKTEAGLRDELQCGTILSSASQNTEPHRFQKRSKSMETNAIGGNNRTKRDRREREEEEENRRNATRSYISQFVDDVENGNVDQSCAKGEDEDDELLREESSVFTKKGESLRESYAFAKTAESVQDDGDLIVKTESKLLSPSPSCELLPFLSKQASSLVGQLRGELPCHSSSFPSPPSLSPVEDCGSHNALPDGRPAAGGRKAITSQEKFKFSSFVTEETRREVRDKESSLPPRKRHNSHSSCCSHLPSPSSLHPCSVGEGAKENVHDFVMEIIDMTSLALKSKENQPEEPNQPDSSGSIPDQGLASLAQIRDKVLEHSHRPLHLRKGDFYAYLSLSSHDSDCGEVSQCFEEKSSTPVPYTIPSYVSPTQGLHSPSPSPELFTSTKLRLSNSSRRSSPDLESKNNFRALDLKSPSGSRAEEPASPSLSLPPSPDIRDEVILFAACTEEVYLGPPLCYSMALTKKPRRVPMKENSECSPSLDPGCEAYSKPNGASDPGDSLSHVSHCEEFALGQDHRMYFQGSIPTEGTHSTLSPFLEPCNPPSSPPLPSVSSGAEEEGVSDPYLLCDVAGGEVAAAASVCPRLEERSRNEGPPYLNPPARVAPIDSSADECLADTKTLESNMGTVMTKISVCGSATNPSKEPAAAAATRINPKINCSPMREADREEGERRGEVESQRAKREEKGRRGRSGSQREAKTAAEKQVSTQSAVNYAARSAQASVKPPASRTTVSRLPVLGAGTSRIQL
ncbi:A-kinase anchor protein 6 [Perca flavescens]|nr:A-kinase anchor protein 6 [Perca flavescens]